MRSLTVPKPNEIVRIEAHVENTYDTKIDGYREEVVITDPIKIEKFTNFLSDLNKGMVELLFSTYPTPTHTIGFKDNNGTNLVVWIGFNWLGGRNNVEGRASTNRLTKISVEERRGLLQLLGLPDYEEADSKE
ncbi:hypothetical protein [Pelagicoccus sp. SDUM812005]|uniref:hypothetical protein n=1 Tax=Pelagicoccus sp. SDUM812005 TaxID=3041257 RepID=UPI00280EB348|nr:hypothetical protein [Pelagicoccus sp. SDUM812005]MDQ8183412.1 hypothetical protein [Pelagicoccus sp. SDUM812005]